MLIFAAITERWRSSIIASNIIPGHESRFPKPPDNMEVVVLTGVTGTLGVWIFHHLRLSDRIGEIHCLIRGGSQYAVEQRLAKALEHKKLPPSNETATARVYCHPCKLHVTETLGLEQDVLGVSWSSFESFG